MKKSPLKKISDKKPQPNAGDVVRLLVKDHEAMRKLMKKIKSQKAKPSGAAKVFDTLVRLVTSHVTSEEAALLSKIKGHPLFEDEVNEGYEEHRIHEVIAAGIRRLKDPERRLTQMQIYCEYLEHHLDEEEEDLFPAFKKHSAPSTRKKIGAVFIRKRKQTRQNRKNIGALKGT